MHSIPVCRSFTLYVDPSSTSVIEFGTIDHPYKEFESVVAELMNFHTHNNRSLKVYVMENTIVYWLLSESYISNITHVTIQSYSKIHAEPNMINIVGVKSSFHRIPPGMHTKFSILGM